MKESKVIWKCHCYWAFVVNLQLEGPREERDAVAQRLSGHSMELSQPLLVFKSHNESSSPAQRGPQELLICSGDFVQTWWWQWRNSSIKANVITIPEKGNGCFCSSFMAFNRHAEPWVLKEDAMSHGEFLCVALIRGGCWEGTPAAEFYS